MSGLGGPLLSTTVSAAAPCCSALPGWCLCVGSTSEEGTCSLSWSLRRLSERMVPCAAWSMWEDDISGECWEGRAGAKIIERPCI